MTTKLHSKPRKAPSVPQDGPGGADVALAPERNAKPVELKLDPRNANRHNDSSLAAVRRSVDRLGAGRSVVADSTGTLIGGEATLRAAQDLGLRLREVRTDGNELVVVVREDLGPDDPRRRALAIADNQTAKLSDFDETTLVEQLRELGCDQDLLTATGFSDQELMDLMAPTLPADVDEDTPPEPQAVVVTRPGDLWTLGQHRLLCGDCRDPAAWERLLGGERINVAFTSPPYASQRKYDESSGFKPIPPDEYVAWWEPVQANVRKHLADDGSFFVNIKPHCEEGERVLYVFDLVLRMRRGWGWRFVDEFCWRKTGVPGEYCPRFRNDFEPIFQFCGTETSKPRYENVLVKGECVSGAGGGSENQGKGGSNLGDQERWQGMVRPGNVLTVLPGRLGELSGHSAAFPIGLPSFFIRAFSDEGDVICDPFMGSFSTGMAAEANNRRAFGFEISAGYCDVCIRRYLANHGGDAIRHDGAKWSELQPEES